MDVLKGNFKDALALLEEMLPTSAFVAIDAEMTGIYVDRSSANCIADNCQVPGHPSHSTGSCLFTAHGAH